jgi:predicted deacetylase
MAIHSPLGSAPAAPAGERWLVVSFHDLAPHTQRPCQELLMLLADLGVPRASLLVVPRWYGMETILERPFFLRWLRSLADAGHEICLQAELQDFGREQAILQDAGFRPHGFAAPGGRLSPESREMLRRRGFEYAVTRQLDLLGEDLRLRAPAVAFSTLGFLGRALSPLAARVRFAASRRQPILRVSVHPQDLYERGVRRALVAVLRRALADREPLTYGELARIVTPSHG